MKGAILRTCLLNTEQCCEIWSGCRPDWVCSAPGHCWVQEQKLRLSPLPIDRPVLAVCFIRHTLLQRCGGGRRTHTHAHTRTTHTPQRVAPRQKLAWPVAFLATGTSTQKFHRQNTLNENFSFHLLKLALLNVGSRSLDALICQSSALLP